jgi:hypothetical protein
LRVKIHKVRGTVIVRALVDSGADHSIFPSVWAKEFGINLAKCKRVRCNTANGPSFVHVHDISLEAEIESMDVRFAMTAAFSKHASMILLGRDDFFKLFRVTFDHAEKTLTLERLD